MKRVIPLLVLVLAIALVVFVTRETTAPERGTRAADAAPDPAAAKQDPPPKRPANGGAIEVPEEYRGLWNPRYAPLDGVVVIKKTGEPPERLLDIGMVLVGPPGLPRDHDATTDRDGTFSLPRIICPALYAVTCKSADGSIRFEDTYEIKEPAEGEDAARLRIEVEPQSVIEGRVIDPHGGGIRDAHVFLDIDRTRSGQKEARLDPRDTRTDRDGGFSLRVPLIPTDRGRITLGARAAGFAPARGRCVAISQVEYRGEVRLLPSPRVRGLIVDGDGKPLARVRVRAGAQRTLQRGESDLDSWAHHRGGAGISTLSPKDGAYTTEVVAAVFLTDGHGRFEATLPFAASTSYLIVEAEGAAPFVRAINRRELESDGLDAGRIAIDVASQPIAVRFVYGDGTPAGNIQAKFQLADVPQHYQVNSPRYRADGQGIVRTRFVRVGGTYTVVVTGGRGANLEFVQVVIEDKHPRVVVPE